MNARVLASIGAVASALASSACCWLPLLLVGLGASVGRVAMLVERFRPLLLGATFGLLAVGFYLNHRRAKQPEACAPGSACATLRGSRLAQLNRTVLWISTAIVLAFAFFPSYVGRLFGAKPSTVAAASDSGTQDWTLAVSGMTCAGCEAAIETALGAVPGVVRADASFEQRQATVTIASASPPSRRALALAISSAGYSLVEPAAERSGHGLAGEWKGTYTSGDGQQIEVLVDLGQIGTRWVGELDVPEFDVEDYPVEVVLQDSTVELHFAVIDAGFRGALSADGVWLRGMCKAPDDEVERPLTFQRVGGPGLSKQLVEIETAAVGRSLVAPLSDDADELRAAFNRDKDKVRLLLLLAPT
jgi:mercuric ion transport protein